MDILNQFLDTQREDMIADLQKWIQIPSVKEPAEGDAPFGKPCKQALEVALSRAEEMGFSVGNLDNYIGYADYGSGESTFGLLVHVDVVPAGEGWTDSKPFEGKIVGNRIFGRGTSDDKGPAVAALYALYAIKQSGLALNKKVRIIFGADEESGWADIAHYKKYQPLPDFAISPDGQYPVVNAEKGILHVNLSKTYEATKLPATILSIESGNRPNVVPGEATAVIVGIPIAIVKQIAQEVEKASKSTIHVSLDEQTNQIKVVVHGMSAHGSTPEEGINALNVLCDLLVRLPFEEDNHPVFQEVVHLCDRFPFEDYEGQSLGIACQDEESGKLSCSFNMLSLGQSGYEGAVDIRYPITFTAPPLMEKIIAAGLNATVRSQSAPHSVSSKSELVQTLLRVYEENTGREGYCIACGGGTYARAIENAVTFGCQFPNTENSMHQPNEFIDLDEFLLNAKILAQAILALCT